MHGVDYDEIRHEMLGRNVGFFDTEYIVGMLHPAEHVIDMVLLKLIERLDSRDILFDAGNEGSSSACHTKQCDGLRGALQCYYLQHMSAWAFECMLAGKSGKAVVYDRRREVAEFADSSLLDQKVSNCRILWQQ